MGKNNKNTPTKTSSKLRFWKIHRRLAKWLLGICIGLFTLLLIVFILFKISPWPNALIIRYGFDKNAVEVSKALEKHIPAGITEVENQVYQKDSSDGRLDVFYPENTTSVLPTVVWVHGGAWVSGDKDNIDNYLKILASHGFTTVGVDYTIAPEAQYPAPLLQLDNALKYLQDNAERLHINPNAIVLAGDSAGSQIVAQMATMITDSSYANEVGIHPTLAANKLKGMLLNCGAYDLALPDYNGPFGKFLHTVLWAYSGKQDFLSDPKMKQASVANYITSSFPPSFITAGNGDPLEAQSTELAAKLGALKVPLSTLFYAKDHQPQLPHEYQFNLDTSDGKQALEKMVEFLNVYAR